MSVEVKIPEVGESVTEIYIGQWRKSEGEHVEQDEELVELESEKATLDLRAPTDGVLSKILKQSGATAEVGEVIATIDDGATAKPAKPAEKAETAPEPVKAKPKEEQPAPQAVTEQTPEAAPKRTQADVETSPKQPASTARTEPEVKPQPPRPAEHVEEREEPAPSEVAGAEEVATSPREERKAMSAVRRRIAMRLVEAQRNAALLTTFNEIDMTAVKELRARYGEAFERRHRTRLGFMSFFVKATIDALQQYPELNAMIDGDDVVYRRYYDIGVAINTDRGLVVPVLRGADAMSFAQIELAISDFASRARDGSLKVDELQGGTFTITNGGVFGSLLSTPIVNPPQSGVLGMHAIQDRPVAVGGQVVIRPMMYAALTYDHRIVDGREAVTFLKRIKEAIEEPTRMLIEV